MALPTRPNGYRVDANDDWNPLINQVNTNTGSITTNTTDITTLNTRTTDASTGNTALGTRVGTLETRTTDASTGNTALGTRATNLEARKTKSYKVSLSQPASIANNAVVNLGSIAIPSPGFTYTLWFSMFTGPQWDTQFGYCNLNIQTSATWGTGVLTQGAIYAQASGLKINGGVWFTTDGNTTRTGAITLYAMLQCQAGNINGMGVGSMSAMVVPS